MKLILSLPLLLKLVDEIWVCISTDVDVGNAENDLSSTIDFFNLVVSEVSVKIQFWWSFIRNLIGYPNHEKSFNDEIWINQALMKALTLSILSKIKHSSNQYHEICINYMIYES